MKIIAPQASAVPAGIKPPLGETQICIVRHGETDWNAAGILQGWLDVLLNEKGRKQAVDMAQILHPAGFSRVYSSSLMRALESARIIASLLGIEPPVGLDGLKERNFGAIQGIPKSELAEQNPLLLQQIMTRNPAASFEQGESMEEFSDRIFAAIRHMAIESPDQRVLAVTHGWVIDVVTRQINNLPRHTILNHKPKNSECLWLSATPNTIQPLMQ